MTPTKEIIEKLKRKKRKLESKLRDIEIKIEELTPIYPLNAVYMINGRKNLYVFLVWNGEIRFFNLTCGNQWQNKLRTKNTKAYKAGHTNGSFRPRYLTEEEVMDILGSRADIDDLNMLEAYEVQAAMYYDRTSDDDIK